MSWDPVCVCESEQGSGLTSIQQNQLEGDWQSSSRVRDGA